MNERKAFIKGDGTENPAVFRVSYCSYWNIVGLHLEDRDFSHSPAKTSSVMSIDHSSNLLIRRNIYARNNRYFNSHLLQAYYSSYLTIEENEFYYFHRHAMNLMYGGHNVIRRNYANSRGYADIPGGYSSESCCTDRGDSMISLYPDHDSIIENNIGEKNEATLDIECAYSAYGCDREKFVGNISLNDFYGLIMITRGDSDGYTTHNTTYTDTVVITPVTNSYVRSPGNASTGGVTVNHSTFIGRSGSAYEGFITDQDLDNVGSKNYLIKVNNSLAVSANSSGIGFYISTAVPAGGSWSWSLDHDNSWNHATNYYPRLGDSHITNSKSVDPKMGTCLVWIPSSSPMKGTGAGGSDIGANIIYEYVNGQLTSTPLWSPTTGQFPHGAVVGGLNDVAGSSAMDVNLRLNVNTNGCALPTANPSGSASN